MAGHWAVGTGVSISGGADGHTSPGTGGLMAGTVVPRAPFASGAMSVQARPTPQPHSRVLWTVVTALPLRTGLNRMSDNAPHLFDHPSLRDDTISVAATGYTLVF